MLRGTFHVANLHIMDNVIKRDFLIQHILKMMPADFYKETHRAFGHTTPHFQKSQNHV